MAKYRVIRHEQSARGMFAPDAVEYVRVREGETLHVGDDIGVTVLSIPMFGRT